MDTSNWRPAQGASGAVHNSTMESVDWRAQPQRQRVVSKIMDALKRHLPFSRYERLQELKKIAERVEAEIYTAATSQSEYSRKTCFMILTMETRLQSPMSDPMLSNSATNTVNPLVPFDSIALSRNPNGGDWQEEVYHKIKAMKDMYLLELRPIQGASGAVGNPNPTSESGDWRAQLQADSRHRVMNKIMEYLKKLLPFSGYEELNKLADRFEEDVCTAATSQSDYLRKISLKILTMENGSQNPMSDLIHSNSAANSVHLWVPLDSAAQTSNPNAGDWQEEIYQKIKAMKDLYLLDLNDMHLKIVSKLQQHGSHPQQLNNPQLEKLRVFKNMLERFMHFLQIPKHAILAGYKDKLDTYEMQIINVVNSNRRKPTAPQQQAASTGSQNPMSDLIHSNSAANSVHLWVPLDSAAQTSNPNAGDWQEEIYQKIKAMKDLYLLDLNDMHLKIVSKLQQHGSHPQQLNNPQLEKLRVFKNMLERFMHFLQIPKHAILAGYKDKLDTYEMQIIDVVNSNRRKPTAPQQQAASTIV